MIIKNAIIKAKFHFSVNKSKGFTIIELVLVIVLMAVLSVTVAPKFFNSDGFQEYAYQAEVVTVLRAVQLKAMQQTDEGICHTIFISSKLLDISNLCGSPTAEEKENEEVLKGSRYIPQVLIADEDSIVFKTDNIASTEFSFDSLGKPINCSNPCEVIILGSETLTVLIESEGFIHGL